VCVWHDWRGDTNFFSDLFEFDKQILERAQSGGCPHCGGRLDRGDYPRKPRGPLEQFGEAYSRRFSLCCSRDGCRRRLTPPSVRFLGRKIYVAALVIAAAAAWIQASRRPGRILDVGRRTVHRWVRWWSGGFVESAFWTEARTRFMPPVIERKLPLTLLERFADQAPEPSAIVAAALEFVRPITTVSSRLLMASG
jgi:hypothetical protein